MHGYFGDMSVDDVLATMPELMAYVVNTPLQEDEVSAIQDKGEFTRITPDLEPETEYIFAVLFSYNDKWYFKSATATLDAEPSGEADDAYKAFLGNGLSPEKPPRTEVSPYIYHQSRAAYAEQILQGKRMVGEQCRKRVPFRGKI